MDKITGYLISNSLFTKLNESGTTKDKRTSQKGKNFDSCVEQAMILLSDDVLCGNLSSKGEELSPQKIYKYEKRKIEAVCNGKMRRY